MNAKIILIFTSTCIISLDACGPFTPKHTACQMCKPFETNLIRRNSSFVFVEKITVSYGMNNDKCKFAVLQCSNPAAKDILIEWYDQSGTGVGITGVITYTLKVIALITCDYNSQWILTENDQTEIIQSATCEYIQ
ncbi:hypothetical protein LOAG_03762 [Loa loa]|uniref:C6 domain-containing protein n=1 Tax=Loa loa TaxID=7209 RepID=A0A1S0U5G3_LOALO|nr:hypothetical protein LOAG_03762 [Loa loa]EFO24727.1 hypothetical protein LOAG_03762 [Loa loa]